MTSSSKFEAGKTYKLNVTLVPEEDYKLASAVTATLNGQYDMSVSVRSGALSCIYRYTVPIKVISSASFQFTSFTDPKPGDYPTRVFATTEGVKIISYDWVDPVTLRSIDRNDPFEAGKSYLLSMAVTTEEGYSFADTLTAKMRGSSMRVSRYASEPDRVYCQITYNFPSGVLKGDVDGNGVINMKDLTTLQRYVNGWDVTVNEANSDLDDSGSINMKDVAALQRLINSL